MASKDITPVRFGGRWLDDGARIELWLEDGSAGLSLEVVPHTRPDTQAIAMLARRVDDPGPGGRAIAIHDPAAEEQLRVEMDEGAVFAAPLDIGWLRSRLDPELLAGLARRAARRVRAEDPHDWKEGDTPRAALGSRVAFADVFPHAWDIVTTYAGRRYALVDRYVLDPSADKQPLELEVVELAGTTSVGVVEVDLHARLKASAKGKAKARRAPTLAQRIADAFRADEAWYALEQRAEEIARVARLVATWSDDLRDPSAPILELFRVLDDLDPDLVDRVNALGVRCAPVLHGMLADPSRDRDAIRTAARMLAAIGDPAGLPHLIAALQDPELDRDDAWPFMEAMGGLAERAVEPLLSALEVADDLETRHRLLEGLVAAGVGDDRILNALLDGVRRDAATAPLLADYGNDGPKVLETLLDLIYERLDVLARGAHDSAEELAYADMQALAEALRGLGAMAPELEARLADARAAYWQARRAALSSLADPLADLDDPDLDDDLDDPDLDDDLDDPDLEDVPMPVRVAPRPGRNDPCWCGNGKKYKKCHLDADEAARLGST